MDSRPATQEHINHVRAYLSQVETELHLRGVHHDQSKLQTPEVEIFDEFTPKLANSTYGSDEYKGFLVSMKPALDHHYKMSRHHPEHFENGYKGMNLIDMMEMLADWKAATLRHHDGDLRKSIRINAARFRYGPEIEKLLVNTAEALGWVK